MDLDFDLDLDGWIFTNRLERKLKRRSAHITIELVENYKILRDNLKEIGKIKGVRRSERLYLWNKSKFKKYFNNARDYIDNILIYLKKNEKEKQAA